MCAIVSLYRVTLVGQGPDTAFKEGGTIVRYKVYDQARNRGGCKFIVRVVGKGSYFIYITLSYLSLFI